MHMKTSSIFSEIQRFDQWWVWAIILITPAFLLILLIRDWDSFNFGASMGAKEWVFILIFALIAASIIFLKVLRLETRIDKEGVKVRFFPIHRTFLEYAWNRIEEAYVRKYSPMMEYGGWGLRFSHKGTAYNVKGNMGLQLKIDQGGRTKKLLIGTQKAEELQKVLNELEV